MEFIEQECPFHQLPINNVCTSENCENNFLCDYCLNIHSKDHKFVISITSLTNNLYEKIIEKNETNSKLSEEIINQITNEYINKVEYDFRIFSDLFLSLLLKNKNNLLQNIQNLKENYLEELQVWTKLKFEYGKNFLECINKNNISINEISIDLERDTNSNNLNVPFMNLMKTITSVLEKEMRTREQNLKNYSDLIINEFNCNIKKEINEDLFELKKEILKISNEKINFSDKNFVNNNNLIFKQNITYSNTPMRNIYDNTILVNDKDKLPIKNDDKTNYHNSSFNTFNNNLKCITISNNVVNPRFENFDFRKFDLEVPQEIFSDKKGSWYTLEYIEQYDYVVCGFQTGEIIFFKETDLTPIKTFRPRFKKMRKLIYSPENSSVFTSYDDGFIVVINLTNFKLEHFRMADNQIYSLEIIPNLNILIFGGVEKKILYSHVINLNKTFLYYDSKDGEIQSLLYEENRDILISAFRKNTLLCFKYSSTEIIFRYEFEGNDCCGMVLKKFRQDSFLTCGYFLNLYHFKFNSSNQVECVGMIKLKFFHLYDVLVINHNYLMITTYDHGKLVLVNFENKDTVQKFAGFKGAIQVKMIKDSLYVTSHCECLKKARIKNEL